MCRVDDAECSTLWLSRHLKARKTHKCWECGRVIAKGEIYQRIKSLYDGRWSTSKTCQHCDAAGTWMEVTCGGYLTGEMLDEMIEHWHEGHKSVGFARLIAGIKQKWHGGTDPVPVGVSVLATKMLVELVAA